MNLTQNQLTLSIPECMEETDEPSVFLLIISFLAKGKCPCLLSTAPPTEKISRYLPLIDH